MILQPNKGEKMSDKKVIPLYDEDEDFLKFIENDTIEEQAKDMGIVSQADDLLAYSIDGLYTNEKQNKFITGKKLRENPPVLKIYSSNGDEVSFLLTKDFTKMLLYSLTEVNKAYAGYKYSVEKKEYSSFKERVLDIPNIIKKHPIETILISLSIGFVIYILIWRS